MGETVSREDTMTRREFLRTLGVASMGLLVTGCVPKQLRTVLERQTRQTQATVAMKRASSYDPQVMARVTRDMFDDLGGIADIVRPGDTVGIKVNLTGGTNSRNIAGLSPTETFVDHPEVVRAVGRLIKDAGASKIYIVEAVYEWQSYRLWGYENVALELGATLVNLNDPAPYADFVDVRVPGRSEIYESFRFNPVLQELDTFVSVAKMKCHWTAGVTHSMKNLFGLVPAQFYRLDPRHNWRSAFHGPDEKTAGYRVPRIITELNRARPIHLAIVDGIKTVEAGEGPWVKGMNAVEPGVILAGKDALATDSVATSIMGFDPAAGSLEVPFVRADNHLALASKLRLGTLDPDRIEVKGPAVADVVYKFRPCWG